MMMKDIVASSLTRLEISAKDPSFEQWLKTSDDLNAKVMKGLTLSVEGINLADNLHTEWRGDKSYFGRMVWARITYKLN